MHDAVIVATARSPIGRARKGSPADLRPGDLALQVLQAALAKVPELAETSIDGLILGCGQPAGEQGHNLAPAAAVPAGLDRAAVPAGLDSVPGTTVNRYCGSSLQTTRMAGHAIRAGEGWVKGRTCRCDAKPPFVRKNQDLIPNGGVASPSRPS